jgi:transposase InsO family protein
MKRKLVEKMKSEGTPLPVALKAAELSSSSYYYKPKGERKPRALDVDLVAAIHEVREGRAEVYGYRKITLALKAQGKTVNAKKVLRHMRILGLTQPRKVKGIGWSRLDVIKPEEQNTYWEADFSYVWTGEGNAYLCAVIDGWDRDIVGDVFSDRCRAVEAAEALEKAVMNRFGGKVPEDHQLTLRVDRGSQFRARLFRETARLLNVKLEYAGVKCPEEKPYIEAFFSNYKTEELYRNEYHSFEEAKAGWESYKEWYRNDRIHQGIDYMSPVQYAQKVQKSILLVA